MSIKIRPAQQADIPAIAELFDLYRQFYSQAPDLALALDFINERFNKRESIVLVAQGEPSPDLLGFCQLYPTFCSVEARPIYSLYDLFVRPSARQSGVGRLLLEAAEARAEADGRVRMDLTTAKSNRAAQSLYESLGWVRDELFFAYSRRTGP